MNCCLLLLRYNCSIQIYIILSHLIFTYYQLFGYFSCLCIIPTMTLRMTIMLASYNYIYNNYNLCFTSNGVLVLKIYTTLQPQQTTNIDTITTVQQWVCVSCISLQYQIQNNSTFKPVPILPILIIWPYLNRQTPKPTT